MSRKFLWALVGGVRRRFNHVTKHFSFLLALPSRASSGFVHGEKQLHEKWLLGLLFSLNVKFHCLWHLMVLKRRQLPRWRNYFLSLSLR